MLLTFGPRQKKQIFDTPSIFPIYPKSILSMYILAQVRLIAHDVVAFSFSNQDKEKFVIDFFGR